MSLRKIEPAVEIKGEYKDFDLVVGSIEGHQDYVKIIPKKEKMPDVDKVPAIYLNVIEKNGFLIEGPDDIKEDLTSINPLITKLNELGYEVEDLEGLIVNINHKIEIMRNHPKYPWKK